MGRCIALLSVALVALPARAECPADVPAAADSSARALSDVPYAKEPAPCPPAQRPREPSAVAPGWSAPSSDPNQDLHRLGIFAVGFGSMLLLAGAQFAICANHGVDPGTRDYCRAVRAPVLVGGGAIAGFGLGTLTYAWLTQEPPRSSGAGLAGGVGLRVALR